MADSSLRSQDDSGGSDKNKSTEFDTEESLDTAEFILLNSYKTAKNV